MVEDKKDLKHRRAKKQVGFSMSLYGCSQAQKCSIIFRMGHFILVEIIVCVIALIVCIFGLLTCADASEINLKASWYSVESLKQEGTFKYSKGVMANGDRFSDSGFTAACRIYPLGALLRVTNTSNNRSVVVRVTDRTGKRFATTRIDLSKGAFLCIEKLNKGIVDVSVERID